MSELPCTSSLPTTSPAFTNKRTASQIQMLCVAILSIFCAPAAPVLAQTSTAVPVLTWRYDQTHAGQNTSETALTTSNVNPDSFGKLFSLKVDSTVYPQPLYVPNLKMSDGQTHNVLFIETSNDSMYAFDADSNGGANANPIWKVSLAATDHGAASGATAIPWQDTGSPDVAPTVGITGTPAIDGATNTMYVVSHTKENGNYFARLHAIDITSGAERSGSPVEIKATVAGTGNGSSGGQLSFSPLWENQRPALALYNGYVYIGFAAHGDNGNWHGWLFSYNASTLAQKAILCLSPNSYGAGIWASGAGLPIDAGAPGGRMFVVNGNGPRTSAPPFDSNSSYGESVVAFSLANGDITPIDEFTPYNYQTLNNSDWDLGSGGILMLPDQQGAHPHVLIVAGKEGRITVLDRDNLGGFASGASSNTNALQDISGLIPQAKGFWSTAAYWNGNVYLWARDNVGMMFKMNTGVIDVEPDSKTTITAAWPDPTFSISSNGTQNGIAWAVRADQFNTKGPAVLYAWDANDLTKTIYESDSNSSRDTAGPANRYSVPVVTNGKVYIATNGEIDVYGLLNGQETAAPPVISPNGGTFSSSQSVTLSSTTASSSIYYTLDGSTPTSSSTLYTAPFTVSTNTTVKAIASAPNFVQSAVSSAVFTFDDQTPTVTFLPAPGTYASAQSVTLSDTDGNARIYYTVDGSAPTASSTLYTGLIQVSATEIIKAIAIDSSKRDSNVANGLYTIQSPANSVDFGSGFSSTTGLTVNGSATASNDSRLQLTNGGLNQAGSVFWNTPVGIQAFSTTFEFQISGDAQANGFTFCIQNTGVTALGGNASGLGYGGILKSVAVKFNFYDFQGEGADSTGVYTNGQPPTLPTTDISPSGIQLNSGDSIQAQLTYDGTTLTLNLLDFVSNKTFTMSQAINIPQIVGGNTAYVGFTGGTGGLSSSQKLLTWTYNAQTPSTAPETPAPSFAMSTSPITAIKAGSSSTSTVTISPSGGFTGAVSLACSITSSPSGAQNAPTCAVDPSASVSGTQPANATLTIKTIAPSASAHLQFPKLFAVGGETLAATVLLFMFPIRRRRWQSLIGALVLVFLLSEVTGCGGTSIPITTSGGGGTPGTTPGNYTITVTGASGTSTANATIDFSVQ
jgi:hypothetical protein